MTKTKEITKLTSREVDWEVGGIYEFKSILSATPSFNPSMQEARWENLDGHYLLTSIDDDSYIDTKGKVQKISRLGLVSKSGGILYTWISDEFGSLKHDVFRVDER